MNLNCGVRRQIQSTRARFPLRLESSYPDSSYTVKEYNGDSENGAKINFCDTQVYLNNGLLNVRCISCCGF